MTDREKQLIQIVRNALIEVREWDKKGEAAEAFEKMTDEILCAGGE